MGKLNVRALVTMSVIPILSACSSMKAVTPDSYFSKDSQSQIKPIDGALYFLPDSQYDISVTWNVVGCEDNNMKLEVAEAVSEKAVKGPAFVLDMQSVQGFSRNGKIEVDYDTNGFVTGVNGSSDDETGAVLSSSISSAAKVITAVIGKFGGEEKTDLCSEYKGALNKKKDAVARLTKAQDVLKQVQAGVDSQTTIISKAGALATAKQKHLLQTSADALLQATDNVSSIQAEINGYNKTLSYTQAATWSPTTDPNFGTVFQLSTDKLAAWYIPQAAGAQYQASVAIEVPPNGLTGSKPSMPLIGFAYPNSNDGIPYRFPAKVAFRFCKTNEITGHCSDADEAKLWGRVSDIRSFQFGYAMILPVKYEIFASRDYAITFDSNYVPTKISLDQTKSPGEGASGVASSAAQAYTDITTAQANAKGKTVKVETAALTLQSNYLTAQKAVLDANNALTKDQNSADQDALQAQVDQATLEASLAKANLDKFTAQQSLTAAQAALSGAN